jgi:hypothetical protein
VTVDKRPGLDSEGNPSLRPMTDFHLTGMTLVTHVSLPSNTHHSPHSNITASNGSHLTSRGLLSESPYVSREDTLEFLHCSQCAVPSIVESLSPAFPCPDVLGYGSCTPSSRRLREIPAFHQEIGPMTTSSGQACQLSLHVVSCRAASGRLLVEAVMAQGCLHF